jgi:hypothetical protein
MKKKRSFKHKKQYYTHRFQTIYLFCLLSILIDLKNYGREI